MDDKKKIVLASEDIIAKNLEDIFININLQQRFNQIKKERFDNNFDVAEQFRRERNASRDFRIYGIIDSKIIDCDNLSISVYSEYNLVGSTFALENLIYTTNSSKIGFGDKNVFGKSRGKYIIELNNYQISSKIYISISGNGSTYNDTIIEQTLVFYGADNNFIEYGTDTVDVSLDGGFVTINNDFPFFYNKHWIKNNFQIEEVKVRNVSFGKSFYSFKEGESGIITLSLDEPSVFGTESVDVIITSSGVEGYENAIIDSDFTVDSSPFSFPINFSWSPGQQFKQIDISALIDFNVENTNETFSLALSNPINLTTDSGVVNIDSTTIQIVDQTTKKYVNYIFQKVVRNIAPLTDIIINPDNLGQFPGYSMNIYGAKDGVGGPSSVNSNYRFFPNDTFDIEITNKGDSTILPIIPGFTTNEQFFASNQTIKISVENIYQNHSSLPLETALFDFKFKNSGVGGIFTSPTYSEYFYINGIKMGPIELGADEFVQKINETYTDLGIDLPFTITQNNTAITLKATHPANNVNGFVTREATFGIGGGGDYALDNNSELPTYPLGRSTTITPQIPFELKLYANLNGTSCKYEFSIKKNGYKTVVIPSQTITASASVTNMYLVSPIRDVVGPSVPFSDPNVCNSLAYSFDINGFYLNGVALIASGAQAKNELIPSFSPQFRSVPLTDELIFCNDVIPFSKILS